MDLAGLHKGLVLAAEDGGSGGNFLVTPGVGLMIWTLIAFGITFVILRKLAFPRIQEALDRRANAIQESIEYAEKTKQEADELLAEYRERLSAARRQAEEIVARARKAAENAERESAEKSREKREELMEQTRRDIEAETRRAIQEIRKEVADMTVLATEKVTRKTLSAEDQRHLVEEALRELDFSALSRENGEGSGSGQRSGGGEA
jgi:F-type H+-transporting ATPase subunit b